MIRSSHRAGVLLGLFAAMAGAATILLLKHLNGLHDAPQVMFFRFLLGLPMVWLLVRWRGPVRPSAVPRRQLLRGTMGFGAMMFGFAAIGRMDVADYTAIIFSSPLILAALSPLLLGERPGAWGWTAVALGFVGTALIARPDLGGVSWPYVFVGVAALLEALCIAQARTIGRSDDGLTTLVWFVAVNLVLSAIVLPFVWHPLAPWEWVLFLAVGTTANLAQLLHAEALRRVPATKVATLQYVMFVFIIAGGALFFAEFPEMPDFLAAALIIVGGSMVARRRQRH